MALLPWMLLMLVVAAAAGQKDRRQTHYTLKAIDVDNRECQSKQGVQTILNGSVVGEWNFYKWEQTTDFDGVAIEPDNEVIVNVTVPRSLNQEERAFRFKLTANDRHQDITTRHLGKRALATTSVHFKEYSSEGVRLFATKVVYSLLKLHYDYIVLTHRHRKATCYHPNVAEYFRNIANDRASMLDQVVQFIHEKQAFEFATTGCPTDYVSMMERDGFKAEVDISDVADDVMITTFKTAYGYETKLGQLLALVYHHAERTAEIELADFIAADLLPQVTKVINSHKNIIETVLAGTESSPERHLTEFLFDKYIKK